MNLMKIPLDALVGTSDLALTSVNTKTRAYGADGKVIDGATGDPKLAFTVMNSLESQSVSVKSLAPEIARLTPEQIEQSLRSRKYICLEFVNATATPYVNKSGFVSYSIKADEARLASTPRPQAQVQQRPVATRPTAVRPTTPPLEIDED